MFLERERAVLESFLPGFDARLASVEFEQLESRDGPAIALFRGAGGPGLLVPREAGGLGATPVEAIQVQRAIGSRCPSLAVATTMHHFSVASLVAVARGGNQFGRLLEAIAADGKLLASGFAEGIHAQGIFSPTMTARRNGDGVLVSGEKKPCSLSRSMDLLTASVTIEPDGDAQEAFAVVVIPAGAPGLTLKPFWGASVLVAAQSDAVVLEDVRVDSSMVVEAGSEASADFDGTQASSCIWFELLVTASYLGIGSALVERLLLAPKADTGKQAAAVAEVEASMAGLDGIARRVVEGEPNLLASTLVCRYACQDAIARAVTIAVEELGGMAFVSSSQVGYLAAASHALAFHPPARSRSASALVDAYRDGTFVLTSAV